MITNEKQLLHQIIDNLSDADCVVVSKLFKGLFYVSQDFEIEELPENEVNHHLEILNEMHNGEYYTLSEIMQELDLRKQDA